eukprot:scaffold3177_cov86-Phaeocystis_antarctica.AAC.3
MRCFEAHHRNSKPLNNTPGASNLSNLGCPATTGFDAAAAVAHRDTHPHPGPHTHPRHDPQLRCYTHSHPQPHPGPHHRPHHRPRRCSYRLRTHIYHAVDGSCASHRTPAEIIASRSRSNSAKAIAPAVPACHPLLRGGLLHTTVSPGIVPTEGRAPTLLTRMPCAAAAWP